MSSRTSTRDRGAPRSDPSKTARGYRVRDFCEREGVTRQTVWNWARKGVVQVSRLGPAVGVRVEYSDAWDE